MNPRTWVLLALLLLATACATDGALPPMASTLDTGSRLALVAENRPLQVTRSPIRRAPVEKRFRRILLSHRNVDSAVGTLTHC
jgi:hypothetical protein